ncbi:Imm10 family immunity protein [Streptomyces poriticola]|uniref:Imm10 family immunity protein n=1 Tax=Streptomyces poriticola TaxID=3120506 RepID=UPI002FCE126C
MTHPSPYWTIAALVVGEAVPGATFTVFIGDGEDAESDGYYFDFQRRLSDEVKEQDVRNETDSYCVVNESGGVYYGGLEEVSLLQDVLCLRFDDGAVEALGLPSNVVPLNIASGIDIHEMRAGLRRVMSYGNPAKIPSMNL